MTPKGMTYLAGASDHPVRAGAAGILGAGRDTVSLDNITDADMHQAHADEDLEWSQYGRDPRFNPVGITLLIAGAVAAVLLAALLRVVTH